MIGKNHIIVFTALLLANLLVGCTRTIEVPANQVAIIVDRAGVGKEILEEGPHNVRKYSDVVFFDVNEKRVEFSFEFMFKDSSPGHMSFILSYRPITGEIVDFFRTYKTDKFEMVLVMELRSDVREMLGAYFPSDLDENSITILLNDKLNKKEGILRFVQIAAIEGVRITH